MSKVEKKYRSLFLPLLATLVGGCSTTSKKPNPQDPLEGFNRGTYAFNQQYDKILLKPVATIYHTVLPAPARKCVANFYDNLSNIPTFINNILQFEFYNATVTVWRFGINSTLGIGGLFDVAQHMDLPPQYTDLGITFAKWGYKNSSYFVIPFLGPSTIRDTVALPINYFATVYPWISPAYARYTLLGVNYVNLRSQFLDLDEARRAASLDPYAFDRSAYLQYRAHLINGGKNDGDNDDYADDLLDGENDASASANQIQKSEASKTADGKDAAATQNSSNATGTTNTAKKDNLTKADSKDTNAKNTNDQNVKTTSSNTTKDVKNNVVTGQANTSAPSTNSNKNTTQQPSAS